MDASLSSNDITSIINTMFFHIRNLVSPLKKFVLDFEEVAFTLLSAEWLIDNRKTRIILQILVSTVTISIKKPIPIFENFGKIYL